MDTILSGRWRKAGTDDYWIIKEINPNGSITLVLPPDPADEFSTELYRVVQDKAELFGGFYRE